MSWKNYVSGRSFGQFEVVSGKLQIGDPCRQRYGAAALLEAVNGTWMTFARKFDHPEWGSLVCMLLAYNPEAALDAQGRNWEECDKVTVDSGGAGVFDSAHYRDDSVAVGVERISMYAANPDDPWYSLCCDRWLSNEGMGTIPFGVVAAAGFGDGRYPALVVRDDTGRAIAVRIVFIPDEEIREMVEEE